jgi:hypothetical protein
MFREAASWKPKMITQARARSARAWERGWSIEEKGLSEGEGVYPGVFDKYVQGKGLHRVAIRKVMKTKGERNASTETADGAAEASGIDAQMGEERVNRG